MRRIALFFTILFLLSAVLPAEAATGRSSVLMTNLNKRQFIVDLTAVPTNMVTLKLNTTQFDTGGNTITITNLTGVPAGTNISYNNLYATNIYVTNLFVTNLTVFNGRTTISNVYQTIEYSTNIFTNVLQTFNSVTNYFTDVFNYSTNVFQTFESTTNIFNESFTYITNSYLVISNTTVTIDGSNVLSGNLTPGTIVKAVDTNRLESIASGTGTLTNDGAGNFGWYPLSASGGDTIWTNDMTLTTLLPGKGASVVLGANAVPWWAPNASDGFTVVHDQAAGESDTTYIYAAAVDDAGASTNNADFQVTLLSTAQAAAQLNLTATTNAVTSRFNVSLQPDAGVSTIVLENQGATKFAVASDSLFSGTGTLFLSDDGTYKSAGGSGDTIWTNNAGVIEPLGGQTTNVLRFTSGLADNATNVAVVVDTASAWTEGKLLSLNTGGNELVYFDETGASVIGQNASTIWGLPRQGESFYAANDVSAGEGSFWGFLSGSWQTNDWSGSYTYASFGGKTNYSSIDIFSQGALHSHAIILEAWPDLPGFGRLRFALSSDGDLVTKLHPTIAADSASVAYILDTAEILPSGAHLLDVNNKSTNKFTVLYDGSITTGGNTNRWIFKDVVEAATTNLTVNVNTKDYVITLGGGGSGTTINPTDTYIPYRSNAATFADSPIWVAPSGDTMVDGAIDVGGSGTSQFSGPVEFADTVTLLSATVTNNIGALLSVGDTTFVDMAKASQTNALTAALTFAHATNGVAGVEYTHVRTFFNGSGSNWGVTIPNEWRKGNSLGATFTVTNNTLVKMYVTTTGPTSSAALQTNVTATAVFFP